MAMFTGRGSLFVILSYVFDWVVIIIGAIIGLVFGNQTPNKRPFTLANPDISFPYVHNEKISTAVLALCGLIIPAGIIIIVALLFVPGPTVPKSTPKSLIWRRKLWEWFTGWTGLALSLVTAWVVTNAMKNLFGQTRPDLLSRCNPDIQNAAKYAVGGIVNTAQGVYLVSAAICQNTDKEILDDGFRSFPSGHSSFSAAGLIYLSLFIASKFAITIPFLNPQSYANSTNAHTFSAFPSRIHHNTGTTNGTTAPYKNTPNNNASGDVFADPAGTDAKIVAARNQSAAPPVYLLVFAIAPFFTAIYISSTRYSDFRHHGFDILFGFFIGTVTAIFSFRWYHLPIAQGAGWSWGPRSRDRAFWSGVGVGSYVNNNLNGNYTPHESVALTNNGLGEASNGHRNERAVDNGQVV